MKQAFESLVAVFRRPRPAGDAVERDWRGRVLTRPEENDEVAREEDPFSFQMTEATTGSTDAPAGNSDEVRSP